MLFRLAGRIVVNNKQAKKGLEEVDRQAKTTADNMTSAFNSIAKGAAVLGAAMVAASAVGYKMVKDFAHGADEIDKTAMKLGMSTDTFQELRYAMGQVGVGSATMERALGRLNQRIGLAAQGNENYTEALYKLGFSYDEVQNGAMSADEVFMKSIDTLHGMESATAQSALASELFGTRMARDLMPAIKAGTLTIDELRQKAHELGGVMGEDSVEAGVKFHDTIDSVNFAMDGLKYAIAESFLPIFQKMAEYMIEKTPEIREKVDSALNSMQKNFGWLWEIIKDHPGKVFATFGALVGTVGAAITLWLGKMALGWLATQATVVAAVAVKTASIVALMATYVKLGVIAAAKGAALAAAWLVAMGPVGLVIAAVIGLVAIIVDNWDKIIEVTEWLWGNIKNIFTKVFDFMKNLFLTFHPLGILIDNWSAVSGFFLELWDRVTEIVSGAFNRLKDLLVSVLPMPLISGAWEKIVGFFEGIWDKVLVGLSAFTSKFKGVWEGLVEIVKIPLDVIVAVLNSMLSGFGIMIDSLAENINRIPEFEIPDWVPGMGGKSFGLPEIPTSNIPKIPALAKGGTITQSGMTMVGEEGPELLSLNRGASVVPLTGSKHNSNGKQVANIYLELDGRTIARVIGEPLVEQIRLRSGVKL